MLIVVSDTSPIRALVHVQQQSVLGALFDRVVIPPAVETELRASSFRVKPVDARALPNVEVRAPTDTARVMKLRSRLGPGESEALALAVELRPAAVLMDEAVGRRVAEELGLVPLGVIGLLCRAKRVGILPAVRPILDRLESEIGFAIGAELKTAALREVDE